MNQILILTALAYVGGGIPIGLLAGKLFRGIDIREFGSGNIGASNVWRTLGWPLGITVFILDVLKGFVPVFYASLHPQFTGWPVIAVGIAAIMGHNFSPFLRFKGGKGVATSLGVTIGLAPLAGLIGFGLWGVLLLITRYISVSSMVTTPLVCLLIWHHNHSTLPYALFGVATTFFVLYTHRSNVARLRKGTEPKVGKKKVIATPDTNGPVP